MSLDDYNRHATFGPAAGAPTTLDEFTGQRAYRERQERFEGVNPHLPRARAEMPRWMTEHAFKRGLALFLGGKLIPLALSLAVPAFSGVLMAVGGLAMLAGAVLMICGALNFLARRR